MESTHRRPLHRLLQLMLGLAALALAALAALTVAQSHEEALSREEAQRLRQLTDEVTSKLEEAHSILRGFQGLFMASQEVTRRDFHAYASALQVRRGMLGLQAAQFARWVADDERAAFEARVRADDSLVPGGYPDFRITPQGTRPFYVATEYNEPMVGNEAAFGFDTAFGTARAAVMEASRDSAQPRASAPFRLVQTGTTGIVMRAPVYRRGLGVDSVADRRRAYQGQVSLVFAADSLLGPALGNHLPVGTEITLTDIGPAQGAAVESASAETPLGRYGGLPAPAVWRPERKQSHSILVHGRLWRLDMRARPLSPLLQERALTAGFLVLMLTLLGAGMVKRATDQRDRAQARAAAIVSATMTGIIAVDGSGAIQSANPAACALFGHEESALTGRPFASLVPEMDGVLAPAGGDSGPAARPPGVGTVRNIVGVTGDGRTLDLAMSLGEVVGARGDRQLLASFHDISIEKRIQEQQRRFARELEATVASRTADLIRVNQELEAFASSVAHDLRAPARHVNGFARVLQMRHSGTLDAKARDYLDRIAAASQGMGRLIDDLLAFSQLNHRELTMTQVDLGAVARNCIDALAPELEGRDVHWQIGPLPQVRADAALLRQVVSNLLDNALKYSARSSPSVISMSSEPGPGEHRICVADNGVGIDMQYAHRLFKVFSRLHHQEEFEGTGVGLANVRRIVERHGGRVWVEGSPGVGASFWFTLPAPGGTV